MSSVLVPVVVPPLRCAPYGVTVSVDDIIFPAYPYATLAEKIDEVSAAIETLEEEMAADTDFVGKKRLALTTMDAASSMGKTYAKQLAKREERIEAATEKIAGLKKQLEEHRRVQAIEADERVVMKLWFNDDVVAETRWDNLSRRRHQVMMLNLTRNFKPSKITIKVSLTGRWEDATVAATVFAPATRGALQAEYVENEEALRRVDEEDAEFADPQSEFDEDFMDAMDRRQPYVDERKRLQGQLDALVPDVQSRDLELDPLLAWTNQSGASVINKRAFRLQIRVEPLFETDVPRVLAVRSHSASESSSNTLRPALMFFIHIASHFGDKHAVAATLALYPSSCAVIADEPGAAAAQARMRWYLETVAGRRIPCITGAQAELDKIIPSLTGPGSATRLVADRFREEGAATVLRFLRERWLGEVAPDEYRGDLQPHRTAVAEWLAGQPLVATSALKVILWMRGKPFKTEGNPSKELMLQLARELAARKLVPLLIGESFPLTEEEQAETGAIDLTEHWKEEVFAGETTHLRQVYMFDLLAQRYGVVGVIGGKSGSLEMTAMLGINTLWFCDGAPPFYEPRLYQWAMVPHYRAISIAGLVKTTRFVGEEPRREEIPYEERRIGVLEGKPLALVRACLDEIAKRKKNGLDLNAIDAVAVEVVV
ncbi:MAG TPA: hypothetical protein VF618_02785 [Thermoanaerobaculia bacterium]